MSKVKIELNLEGINEMMKSGPIQGAVLEAGQAVAAAAGEGYAAEVHQANWVAISNVYAETPEAKRDNLRNNTLLKALGSTGLPMSK